VPDVRGKRRDIRVPNFLAYIIKPFHRLFRRRKPYYTIVVEKGDAKKDVEQFTGISWTELLKYNDLSAKTRPKVGLELKVPNRRRRS